MDPTERFTRRRRSFLMGAPVTNMAKTSFTYLAQTQHFCYEPPIGRNQLIGKGFQRCHVF
jgi:hypothetical protein